MLRVPGTKENLFSARAEGCDVRVLYSPIDAIKIAQENPLKQIVFFGIGFETTAPSTAFVIHSAQKNNIQNLSLLISHVLVPPAIKLLLTNNEAQIDAFLAPGHVCAITGTTAYEKLAHEFHLPFVVTGFEPIDILQGITFCVEQLKNNKPAVINQYARSVTRAGNLPAQKLINEIFETCDMEWRGIGLIKQSGLRIKKEYESFDAEKRFVTALSESGFQPLSSPEDKNCGSVLKGILKPTNCPLFGKSCNPEHPIGAPMVSSEGACAAYFGSSRS